MQKTLSNIAKIQGMGLHSGVTVSLEIHPAGVDHGIVFERTDLKSSENRIPALWSNVVNTKLCSVIGNEHGATVSTIEHLMAAFRGLGIDNALIKIDAGEVPILDGSSIAFINAIDEVGIVAQDAPRKAIRVLKEVTFEDNGRKVTLSPSAVPVYAGQIDYDNPTIGSQKYEMNLVNGNFRHDVADCRTFCLKTDIDVMQSNGLALGGTLDNAVVVDDNGVMNEKGLRCETEFIRHKILDAVGDLALAGGLILGRYEGVRGGHEMNNKVLHALFSDPSNYKYTDLHIEFENESPLFYEEPALYAVSS